MAYVDSDGGVWATRVRADGSTGSPLPAAQGQQVVRDLQVAVTEGGELVVLWATTGRIRYAVAPSGRSFAGSRTLSAVASHTAATPRMAALRGGTVAVVFRDRGALRYARRAPRGAFGPVRSLGHDGVAPEIRATPGGGALLAWGRGPLTRRALEIATARRGAALPGRGRSVAGRIRAFTLTAGDDGTAWVAWTARTTGTSGFARRIRAANAGAVGPVQGLGNVAYGVPRVALGRGPRPRRLERAGPVRAVGRRPRLRDGRPAPRSDPRARSAPAASRRPRRRPRSAARRSSWCSPGRCRTARRWGCATR